MNQVLRLLEEEQPAPLLREGGPLSAALAAWRGSLQALTAAPEAGELRELEQGKLELAGRVAVLQKECADLRARNAELLEEIVQLNQRQQGVRKEQLEQQLQRDSARAEAKRLDLERRDLARRVATLEAGASTETIQPSPVRSADQETPSGDAKRRRRRVAAPEPDRARAAAPEPDRARGSRRSSRTAVKPTPRENAKKDRPAQRRRKR